MSLVYDPVCRLFGWGEMSLLQRKQTSIKVNCSCRKLLRFFRQFLSVFGVLKKFVACFRSHVVCRLSPGRDSVARSRKSCAACPPKTRFSQDEWRVRVGLFEIFSRFVSTRLRNLKVPKSGRPRALLLNDILNINTFKCSKS